MYIPDPVVSMSIYPTNSQDRIKFSKAIARFTKEDPSLRFDWDEENQESIVSGMGELHLEVYSQVNKYIFFIIL